jgi:hypothetical protein
MQTFYKNVFRKGFNKRHTKHAYGNVKQHS